MLALYILLGILALFVAVVAIRTALFRPKAQKPVSDEPAPFNRDKAINALAELIAGDGAYTPYRFVSFTVLDTRLALDAEPVFCDYDGEDSSIEDILRALDRGMDCAAAL